MYRTEVSSQPRALQTGDVLANGLELATAWYEVGNGGVGLGFTDGTSRVVAARIPLLLKGGHFGKLPGELAVGDILETGDVVLAPSSPIDQDDVDWESSRHEVSITINGGLDGATIGVPEGLIIALSSESYPPSQDTAFGRFVVEQALSMGAKARRHLPFYGRLDGTPELERMRTVSENIEALRAKAQAERAVYNNTLAELNEQCKQLRGIELVITGRLQGRGNVVVYSNDPRSLVEDLPIEITSASVNAGENHGGLVARHVPFIEFQGRTIEDDEHVSGWLGVGEFGVTAVVPEDQQPAQEQEPELAYRGLDKIAQRAIAAIGRGQTQGRPLFEAADSVVRDEEAQRKEVLKARAEGSDAPLDPELFPPDVFDEDGNRRTYTDGSPRLTPAEERRAFELDDSRKSFS